MCTQRVRAEFVVMDRDSFMRVHLNYVILQGYLLLYCLAAMRQETVVPFNGVRTPKPTWRPNGRNYVSGRTSV